MEKNEFDLMFDEVFEKAAKDLPSPNPDPSWSKIEGLLKEKRLFQKFRIFPYAVAVSFILGAFIFGSPNVTKAFNPFIQTIENIQTGVISFIFGNDTNKDGNAKTSAPPNKAKEGKVLTQSEDVEIHYKSWEEASKQLSFAAPQFGYIPTQFELADVILFTGNHSVAKKAELTYSNVQAKEKFSITLRQLEQNESLTTGSNTENGEYQTVQINSQPGFLFTSSDNRASLDFMSGNKVISIVGSLTQEQIVQIAQNIK
jgi:hypothetical protein